MKNEKALSIFKVILYDLNDVTLDFKRWFDEDLNDSRLKKGFSVEQTEFQGRNLLEVIQYGRREVFLLIKKFERDHKLEMRRVELAIASQRDGDDYIGHKD